LQPLFSTGESSPKGENFKKFEIRKRSDFGGFQSPKVKENVKIVTYEKEVIWFSVRNLKFRRMIKD
jgi:hypothetical protein